DVATIDGDRGAECAVSIHGGGCAHVQVRPVQLTGGQLGDVVERSGGNRACHRCRRCRELLPHHLHVRVVGIERGASREHERFVRQRYTGLLERGEDRCAGDGEGVPVCYDQHWSAWDTVAAPAPG